MTKGINRQIIEVTDTKHPYFERALLVVRPDCADTRPEYLNGEAYRFLDRAQTYSGLRLKRRKQRLFSVLTSIATGAGGVVIGWLLSHIRERDRRRQPREPFIRTKKRNILLNVPFFGAEMTDSLKTVMSIFKVKCFNQGYNACATTSNKSVKEVAPGS